MNKNGKITLLAPFGPKRGGMVELATILSIMFQNAGYSVRRVDKGVANSNPFSLLRLYTQIIWNVASGDILITISSSGKSLWLVDFFAAFLGRILGRKTILDFVGGAAVDQAGNWHYIKKLAFRLPDTVVVPTAVMKESMINHGIAASFRVIPHTVDVEFFRAGIRKRIDSSKKVVLSAKNLDSYANVGHIIKAVATVSEKIPEIELWIAGSGKEESNLKKLAEELLPGKTVFLGNISRENMRQALADADLLAHATQYESFGILLVEAMAAGKPIVSYAVGGIPEVIKSDETGYLVDYGDIDAMSQKIWVLLKDKKVWTEMSESEVKESVKYSKSTIMEQWNVLFQPVEEAH